MMKKFLKIATVLSSTIALVTPNLAYATEPGTGSGHTEVTGSGSRDVSRDVYADFDLAQITRYAIDVFYGADLVFNYRLADVYNPGTMTNQGNNIPTLEGEEAETQAKTTAGTADGAWFGFDGVINRLVVINRSNQDVKMVATSSNKELNQATEASYGEYKSTASINLFLNGDFLEDAQRKLNVTSSPDIALSSGDAYQAGAVLYETGDTAGYTDNMTALLTHRNAFSTKAEDTQGGRFSANPEDATIAENNSEGKVLSANQWNCVTQEGVSANNFVNIMKHSCENNEHSLGYALVYFDISGKPFGDETVKTSSISIAGSSLENASKNTIGTIVLTFNVVPTESGSGEPTAP